MEERVMTEKTETHTHTEIELTLVILPGVIAMATAIVTKAASH